MYTGSRDLLQWAVGLSCIIALSCDLCLWHK